MDNRAVSSHNAKIRIDRARTSRIVTELRSRTSTSYPAVRATTVDMVDRFNRIQPDPIQRGDYANIMRLAEAEVDNSISVAETLFDVDTEESIEGADEPSGILCYLGDLSEDLLARWKGAMFAMSPANPDAARHFCTSAREIFVDILEGWASDEEVLATDPDCQMTPNGSKPTRRAKIQYLLSLKGADTPEMIGFVDADIDNVLALFKDLNSATHGPAGRFEFAKLRAIRKRVEGGIMFLASIAA